MADEEEYTPPEEGTEDIWDWLDDYELKEERDLMLQHLAINVYPVVQVYDGAIYDEHAEDFPGELIEQHYSQSGLIIYIYEYAIIIGVGERSHSEYGNRRGMLAAMQEVFEEILMDKGIAKEWNLEVSASHEYYVDVAWALGQSLGLSVDPLPPSDHAFDVLERLREVYGESVPKSLTPKVKPQGR